MTKKRGLGKSLDSLGLNELLSNSTNTPKAVDTTELQNISLAACHPSRFQPRRDINPEDLKELADSIRAQGIIQPILVRQREDNDYEIIAGERRWRAACQIELGTIPAIVKSLSDESCMAQALIENLQRRDLNPIEEANAFKKLIEEFELSHASVAEAIGKSRSAVTNQLRLLNLCAAAQQHICAGEIEMGHARAMLSLDETNQQRICEQIIKHKWSVRQTEQAIRNKSAEANVPLNKPTNPELQHIKTRLEGRFNTKIQLQQQASGKGKVVLHFKNQQQLDELLELLA